MGEPTKTEFVEEISLDESLEDAREAIDKFLNNKFDFCYFKYQIKTKIKNCFMLVAF